MAGNLARSNELNIGQSYWIKIITVLSLFFLFTPLVILIIYSFNGSKIVTSWEGFSLKWYSAIFSDRTIWASVRNTLVIAVFNTIISTILGTMAALVLGKYRFKGKELLQNVLYIPVIIPEIIFGVSLLILFVLIDFPLGIFSVICAHITFSISFVALIVLAKITSLDKSLEEASMDLGANRWQTFWKIILPQISPGIISGALFAFTLSIDDFVVTFFTSGAGASTLPLKIYSLIKFGVTPAINAISTILIIITVIVILLATFISTSENIPKYLKIALSSVFVLIISVLFYFTLFPPESKEVNIYTWADYIDSDLIQKFEEEYKIKVNMDYFNDNEELLAKIQMGASSADIIIPSNYMVEIMIKEKLLAEIDFKNIPNYSCIESDFKNLNFDPKSKYSIPYTYGFSGIGYNSDKIKDSINSWRVFWDEKYDGQLLMLDDMREVFHVAYVLLGYNLNNKNYDELRKALELLLKGKKLLQKYDNNLGSDYLLAGEVDLIQTWNGNLAKLAIEHPEYKFIIPKEGSLYFVDNLVIPNNSANKKNAELFINFMLNPENSAQNIKKILYAMPNKDVKKYLDPALYSSLFFNISDYPKCEIPIDLGEFNSDLEKAWMELKSGK